jgi:hypothetical protein
MEDAVEDVVSKGQFDHEEHRANIINVYTEAVRTRCGEPILQMMEKMITLTKREREASRLRGGANLAAVKRKQAGYMGSNMGALAGGASGLHSLSGGAGLVKTARLQNAFYWDLMAKMRKQRVQYLLAMYTLVKEVADSGHAPPAFVDLVKGLLADREHGNAQKNLGDSMAWIKMERRIKELVPTDVARVILKCGAADCGPIPESLKGGHHGRYNGHDGHGHDGHYDDHHDSSPMRGGGDMASWLAGGMNDHDDDLSSSESSYDEDGDGASWLEGGGDYSSSMFDDVSMTSDVPSEAAGMSGGAQAVYAAMKNAS